MQSTEKNVPLRLADVVMAVFQNEELAKILQGMLEPYYEWASDYSYTATNAELKCWGKRLFNKRRVEWLSNDEIGKIHSAIREKRRAKHVWKLA